MANKLKIEIFLSLLKLGLWEDLNSQPDNQKFAYYSVNESDFNEIYNLAEEQSVLGIITAGIDNLKDIKIPQVISLQFIGATVQIEQRNKEMDKALSKLQNKMMKAGIYSVLVKGQGIAQCYSRPLWRSSGDIDLLLNLDNYKKAKNFFGEIASRIDDEDSYSLHQSYSVNDWEIELHGSLRNRLGKRVDKGIDNIQDEVFKYGEVRIWNNNGTDIFLPSPTHDVVFVFTHLIGHFFKGGIGLRQVSDWCRLLWTYRDSIDRRKLKNLLIRMGLMTEWKAFGSLVVEFMGMPMEAMPFYSSTNNNHRKAKSILSFMLETGNMGHNRDVTYFSKYPILVTKIISLWRHTKDALKLFLIFPKDAIRVWFLVVIRGVDVVLNKKIKS